MSPLTLLPRLCNPCAERPPGSIGMYCGAVFARSMMVLPNCWNGLTAPSVILLELSAPMTPIQRMPRARILRMILPSQLNPRLIGLPFSSVPMGTPLIERKRAVFPSPNFNVCEVPLPTEVTYDRCDHEDPIFPFIVRAVKSMPKTRAAATYTGTMASDRKVSMPNDSLSLSVLNFPFAK